MIRTHVVVTTGVELRRAVPTEMAAAWALRGFRDRLRRQTMVITLELPDDVFSVPKPTAQVAREVREAVAAFWSARGELVPAGRERLLEPAAAPELDFKALLLEMPDVGDDADFERARDLGRPDEPWDT